MVFSLSVAAQRALLKTPATPDKNLLHFPRQETGTAPHRATAFGRRSITPQGTSYYSARINKQQSYRTHEEQPPSRRGAKYRINPQKRTNRKPVMAVDTSDRFSYAAIRIDSRTLA